MTKSQVVKLLVALALPLGLGAVAGFFTSESIPGWFASLNRPSFSPPNWLFGPVWTALYILMGISLYLIWNKKPGEERQRAIMVFLVQLALNFAWSFIFFYYHEIGLALVEIVLLWISILWMLVLFYRMKPLAAYINIPYLLWVTFATILNAGYFLLNRSN